MSFVVCYSSSALYFSEVNVITPPQWSCYMKQLLNSTSSTPFFQRLITSKLAILSIDSIWSKSIFSPYYQTRLKMLPQHRKETRTTWSQKARRGNLMTVSSFIWDVPVFLWFLTFNFLTLKLCLWFFSRVYGAKLSSAKRVNGILGRLFTYNKHNWTDLILSIETSDLTDVYFFNGHTL